MVLLKADNHAAAVAKMLEARGVHYDWSWLPAKVGYDIYDEGAAVFSRAPITDAERAMVRDYLYDYATPDEQLYKSMIALILRSAAARCIIPMQDWLGLDNAARINKPSTVGQNWRWRLKKTQLTKKLQKEICQLTTRYGRKNWA